jgi:hypothetical protein
MRKNNAKASKNGLKRHQKNINRKKRAKELRDFNNLVAYYKWMAEMRKQQQQQLAALNVEKAEAAS